MNSRLTQMKSAGRPTSAATRKTADQPTSAARLKASATVLAKPTPARRIASASAATNAAKPQSAQFKTPAATIIAAHRPVVPNAAANVSAAASDTSSPHCRDRQSREPVGDQERKTDAHHHRLPLPLVPSGLDLTGGLRFDISLLVAASVPIDMDIPAWPAPFNIAALDGFQRQDATLHASSCTTLLNAGAWQHTAPSQPQCVELEAKSVGEAGSEQRHPSLELHEDHAALMPPAAAPPPRAKVCSPLASRRTPVIFCGSETGSEILGSQRNVNTSS